MSGAWIGLLLVEHGLSSDTITGTDCVFMGAFVDA